ncbi:hypothetical protein ACFL6U_06960 [Planctomycetota bacterium]
MLSSVSCKRGTAQETRIVFFQWILLIFFLQSGVVSKATETPIISEPTLLVIGMVRDDQGPISNAVVRIQATKIYTTTDIHGQFVLTGLPGDESLYLTAWASGYYIGGKQSVKPHIDPVHITLLRHTEQDNPRYRWLSAFAEDGDSGNCQNCHSEPNDPNSQQPFDQWVQDAHAQSARNVRFLTMYTGTDVMGNTSPLTRYGYSRDYGTFPLPSDPNAPYFGPGYKLDFPTTAGNCASCHVSAAAINNPYGVNPVEVTGVGTEGIGCDFCHKIWDVSLNQTTGIPYENRPGVLSYEFRRPPAGHQFFAGPFDDVAPGEDTYSPLQQQSAYCAPCHIASFWGIPIYNSFGEWLDSPYSDPNTGKTCQDCHMPAGLTDHFARFDKGGQKRDPTDIFSHRMLGVSDEEFMQNAVTLMARADLQDRVIRVDVEIHNDRTGHHVPTDSPLRHLILWVEASDADEKPLTQLEGPKIPPWCGTGDPNQGYYAGLAGTAYAKILEQLWTGIRPTAAYWTMTRIESDNRIPALGKDHTTYTFVAPMQGEIIVNVRLLFRRAFIELMDQKGWDMADMVMAQQVLILGEEEPIKR